jgi:hypothetical protein
MRRSPAPLLAAAALAAAALPAAPAHAGSWTASRAATSAGTSFGPSAAVDARGRLAIGWSRRLGGQNRAELRQGTLRGLLRGAANVLDRSSGGVEAPSLAFAPDGVLAAAWRRSVDRAQRLRGATVTTGGSTSGPFALTPTGTESAYDPRFVTGPGGALRLVWDRRTSSQTAPLTGTSFGAATTLPTSGIGSQPSVVVDAAGTTVVAWSQAGRMLTAQARAGEAFSPSAELPSAGYARDPQLALTADGDVVAAWLASAGAGNAIMGASRAPGGTFGAPYEIAPAAVHAFSLRLTATSAAEVLVAYITSRAARGYGGSTGPVRLQRLGGDGRPVAAPVTLSPSGVRAISPSIAHDGTGSAFVGWTGVHAGNRTVQVRRVAPGGILGAVRDLGPGDLGGGEAPALAGAGGRGVAAWVRGDRVRYSVYR